MGRDARALAGTSGGPGARFSSRHQRRGRDTICRAPTDARINVIEAAKYSGRASVASGWGLEPADGFAPRGGVSAAHRCLQPHHQAVTGDGPSTWAGFW